MNIKHELALCNSKEEVKNKKKLRGCTVKYFELQLRDTAN